MISSRPGEPRTSIPHPSLRAAATAIVMSSRMELCIVRQAYSAALLRCSLLTPPGSASAGVSGWHLLVLIARVYHYFDKLLCFRARVALEGRCCRMRRARRSTLLAACKTLEIRYAVERTPRFRVERVMITKPKNLRNPEQARAPRLLLGRQRRARQDVLLNQPSERVALAQFGVQRHGDLAQGLAEGPIT